MEFADDYLITDAQAAFIYEETAVYMSTAAVWHRSTRAERCPQTGLIITDNIPEYLAYLTAEQTREISDEAFKVLQAAGGVAIRYMPPGYGMRVLTPDGEKTEGNARLISYTVVHDSVSGFDVVNYDIDAADGYGSEDDSYAPLKTVVAASTGELTAHPDVDNMTEAEYKAYIQAERERLISIAEARQISGLNAFTREEGDALIALVLGLKKFDRLPACA
jgi:hypothetical protein